jgi:hypothetical protein
MDAMIE